MGIRAARMRLQHAEIVGQPATAAETALAEAASAKSSAVKSSPAPGRRSETAQGRGPGMRGAAKSAAGTFLAAGRHGVEIMRQPRAGGAGMEILIRRFAEGRPWRRRRLERVIAQGVVERAGGAVAGRSLDRDGAAAAVSGPGGLLFDHPHLDLVGAEAQAVAIAERARGVLAKRVGIGVQIGSVRAGVGDVPDAAPERDGEMAFRQQPVGIGEHPVHVRAAADVKFTPGYRAGLRVDFVRAPQHGHQKLHERRLLSCSARL